MCATTHKKQLINNKRARCETSPRSFFITGNIIGFDSLEIRTSYMSRPLIAMLVLSLNVLLRVLMSFGNV